MNISAAKNLTTTTPVTVSRPVSAQPVTSQSVSNQPVISQKPESAGNNVKNKENQQESNLNENGKKPSEQDLQYMTEHLNTFMQAISTDIKFVLHAKTNQLIVQVEDTRSHKMLKEFPAHELLDMVARIKDCVGGLVDRNA